MSRVWPCLTHAASSFNQPYDHTLTAPNHALISHSSTHVQPSFIGALGVATATDDMYSTHASLDVMNALHSPLIALPVPAPYASSDSPQVSAPPIMHPQLPSPQRLSSAFSRQLSAPEAIHQADHRPTPHTDNVPVFGTDQRPDIVFLFRSISENDSCLVSWPSCFKTVFISRCSLHPLAVLNCFQSSWTGSLTDDWSYDTLTHILFLSGMLLDAFPSSPTGDLLDR